MKKLLLFILLASFMTGCSVQNSTSNSKRRIQEKVVVVKSNDKETILSSGRYDKWYKVDTRLNEGMTYSVTMEIPVQREKSNVITAVLIDFSPGDFINRDVFARYQMAYNQVKTGDGN